MTAWSVLQGPVLSAQRGDLPQTVLPPSETLKTGRGHGAVAHRNCLHKGQRDSSGGGSCNANISCLLRHAIRHQSAAGLGERGTLGSPSGLDCSHQLCEPGVANKGQSFYHVREQKGCFIASQSRPALTRHCINTFCSFLFINGAFS